MVQATRYPFYDKPDLYFARVYPQRTYLMGLRVRGTFPDGMYISAEEPTRTLRPHTGSDISVVLVGGENHKTGHGKNLHNHYEIIRDFVKPMFDIESIPYRWSAQDYTAMDEIPFIGPVTSGKKRIFVATGFDKWGITNGTAAAMIISDLITKGESPWEEVYSPSRFTPAASAKNFIKENVDVAVSLISGKLNIPEGTVEVEKGKAEITEVDGNKVGVYRDADGKLHYEHNVPFGLPAQVESGRVFMHARACSWFTYTRSNEDLPLESIKPLETDPAPATATVLPDRMR